MELLMAGRDYDEIAQELGYANRSGAWRAVQRALKRRRDELADDHLRLELERLDAPPTAAWDAAVGGDLKAIAAVLKIVDRRCELLGLLPPKGPAGNLAGNRRRKRRLWSTQRSSSRKRRRGSHPASCGSSTSGSGSSASTSTTRGPRRRRPWWWTRATWRHGRKRRSRMRRRLTVTGTDSATRAWFTAKAVVDADRASACLPVGVGVLARWAGLRG